MWDEEQNQQNARNQMRAVILMTALLLGWYFFFIPRTPVVEEPQEDAAQGQLSSASDFDANADSLASRTSPPTSDDSWPFLPPVPQPEPGDEVSISDDHLVLTFTKIGGRLKRAEVFLGENGEDSIQFVPESAEPDPDVIYPLGLHFTNEEIGEELNRRRFSVARDSDGRGVTFTLELPDTAIVRKQFRLGDNPHVLDAKIEYENLEDASRILGLDTTPAYSLYWAPDVITHDTSRGFQPSVVWRQDGANDDLNIAKLGPSQSPVAFDVDWFGYKSKYFLVTFKPEYAGANALASANETGFTFAVTAPRFEAREGETISHDFRIYIGPKELASLGDAWKTLPSALTFFTMFETMDKFAKLLLGLLHWFYEHTIPNYGVAIILLTIVVRVVMLPLTLKGMKSMKKMQALAPEMEKLRELHKDDQQELSKATMEMYRERGVNPVGGCLPMILQMPIFIALYRMLWNAYEMRGAPFLWVEDLSQPDCLIHLPFMANVPFVGEWLQCFNLLPLLMGAAMVISMKITPTAGVQNPQQKMMMTLMPIIFSVFCYPLAAGLNLYVLTSTVLGIAQQQIVRASGPAAVPPPVKKKLQKKKQKNQSVWTRTQQMKRQQKKEAKKQQAKEQRLDRVQRHQEARKPNAQSDDDGSEAKTSGPGPDGKSKKKRKGKRKGKKK